MKNLLTLIVLVLNIHIGISQSPYLAIDFEQLQLDIDSAVIKSKTPGAQVAVFTGDSILFSENFGYSDLTDSIKVTDETFFRIGSITKMFVSTAALQLVEQGKLTVDTKLSDVVDDVEWTNKWVDTHPITMAHLMEHTTGFDDMRLKEYAAIAKGWSLKRGIDFHPNNRYARYRPGLHSSYCNSGPPLVAYSIEKITGDDYESYVRNNIFLPLGMQHSNFQLTGVAEERLSKGYTPNNTEAKYWHISQRPSGSVNSNATEMVGFGQMLINRGRLDSVTILSSSSVDRMELNKTSLAGQANIPYGYGLHNYTTNYKGLEWHGHNGGMQGFLSDMKYNSERDIGFIVLVNSTGSGLGKIVNELNEAMIEIDPQDSLQSNTELSAASYEDYFGYYRPAVARNHITRFFDVFNLTKFGKDDEGLYTKTVLGGSTNRPVMVGKNMVESESASGSRSPAYFATYDGDVYMQVVNRLGNLKKISAFTAFAPLVIGGMALAGVLILSIYGLIWILLRAFGTIKKGSWSIRLIPIVISASIIAFLTCFGLGQSGDVFANLGSVSTYSVGIFLSGILMALLSLWYGYSAIKLDKIDHSKFFRYVSILVSLLLVVSSFYLWQMDLIGLRIWAY